MSLVVATHGQIPLFAYRTGPIGRSAYGRHSIRRARAPLVRPSGSFPRCRGGVATVSIDPTRRSGACPQRCEVPMPAQIARRRNVPMRRACLLPLGRPIRPEPYSSVQDLERAQARSPRGRKDAGWLSSAD
ncbi:protein of unassigned function [Methylobacterium oryzae CBMB20]|uniref:Protein of unassigned function n=1 Tax=Methylobacterium oryzae CBMB20 TaxID=693986 RepID=A0A089NNH4_9HYPH|nr:protein of unassigned function [Methylobacterium oryzae CBMB20]